MRALFITGGTGFIGRRLLRTLDAGAYRRIICLVRPGTSAVTPTGTAGSLRFVTGDLRDPPSYAHHLAGCDTVVHLAAVTGRAMPEDAFAVNADATRALVHECRRAGVRDFLLASTIAVKYPDVRHYAYARAKQLAEEAVRGSGLRYAIVRPTIVLGADSPVWRQLAGLAARRVIVMPGHGRVRVQPIFVGDLVSSILMLLRHDDFDQRIYELGGPEIVSFDSFVRRIHLIRSGHEPRVIHVPLGPVVPLLRLIEAAVKSVPIRVGQLSAFRYDSTADPALALRDPSSRSLGIDDMIRKCLADG
jgi:NADH dehydrogenase